MLISLSTWLYDYLPVDELMRKVRKAGYKTIEVSGVSWRKKWPWKHLIQSAQKNGVRIFSVHCTHHEIPEDEMDEKRYLEYHREFYRDIAGLPGLLVVEHMPVGAFKNVKKKALARLNILKELAEKYGLVLSLENVMGTAFENPDEAEVFLKDDLPFTFDAAHAAYINIDPMKFARFFPQIVNVHVYDVDREIVLGLGDWLPPGLGKISWDKIIAALKKTNYKGALTVELNEKRLKKVFSLFKENASVLKHNLLLGKAYGQIDDIFADYSKNYLKKRI